MKHALILTIFIALAFSTAIADDIEIDLSDVGEVRLDNSGAEAAQQSFLHGLAQLHNFEYKTAAKDFIAAQKIDPAFALAYWGEAMSYNHGIWQEQDKKKALAALKKYAPTPAARQRRAPDDMASDLLTAVDILYGAGDKKDNDDRYQTKMASLYAKYPDNVEIASFYALSIMGSAHEGRDFALYMRAAAIAEDFIAGYPNHPGIAHYLIHATDDPIHAPLGLRAANAYGDIAPNAPHAQHMTTHIYLALGMWDGVIRANVRATKLTNDARALEGKPTIACGHFPSWLMYGYLQVGRIDSATAIMKRCHEIATREERENKRVLNHYTWMRALYLFDTADWRGPIALMQADLKASLRATFNDQYLKGLIALKQGDSDRATDAYEEASQTLTLLNKQWDKEKVPADQPFRSRPDVQLLQLMAQIKLYGGKNDEAIRLLRDAVALEMTLPFGFGPPRPSKPSLEMLGEALLKVGKPEEAQVVLQKALSRTKGKALTLTALAEAEKAIR